MTDRERFPTYVDERGVLTAVELGDVPFPVRRVFVVHGTDMVRPRGGHGAPCEELVVLLSGSACFRVSSDDQPGPTTILRERGERLWLRPGEHVSYELDGPTSAILVLASEPYSPTTEPR